MISVSVVWYDSGKIILKWNFRLFIFSDVILVMYKKKKIME